MEDIQKMVEDIQNNPEAFYQADKMLGKGEHYENPEGDQITADITTQGWPSWLPFCLPGGYRHCGPGCGDGLAKGGGTPINPTDSCCRGHDRCYANFPNNKSCCDKQLVDCVRTHNTAAAAGIRTYFAGGRC